MATCEEKGCENEGTMDNKLGLILCNVCSKHIYYERQFEAEQNDYMHGSDNW